MKRRTLPFAAGLAATAALLLTVCGSGDASSKGNHTIAGADQETVTPTASASDSSAQAEDKQDGLDVSLPKDMNLGFATFLLAIFRGVDERTTRDAAVTRMPPRVD
ncbi:hypothetical protein ACIHCM_06480 [Streptomyces sp. NPDC052023]|uniref:hypothetical protein n=1 Tax=Streptomyces sp. NPDC052023 TaxID=3365681 RepID=UPI0037D8496D